MVTAELVKRAEILEHEKFFEAPVREVGIDQNTLLRWMRIMVHCGGDLVERVIFCQDYFITTLTYLEPTYPDRVTNGLVQIPYTTDDASQRRAISVVQSIILGRKREAARENDKEPTVSHMRGPERIEVTLRENGKLKFPRIRLAVTGLAAPEGHFPSFSVTGRPWTPGHMELLGNTETYWSQSHSIVAMEHYQPGVATSTTQPFSEEEAHLGWKALQRALRKIPLHQIKTLEKWAPEKPTGLVAGSRLSSSTRTPSHHGITEWNRSQTSYYGTESTHYRVAGDEVGAKLYREQEKRAEAPEDDGLAAEVKPTADETLVDDAIDDDDACDVCGSADCDPGMCNSFPAHAGFPGAMH